MLELRDVNSFYGKAHILRLEGDALDDELMESLMLEIQSLLEK